MVKAAVLLVCWQFYVADVFEAEMGDLPRRLRDVVL